MVVVIQLYAVCCQNVQECILKDGFYIKNTYFVEDSGGVQNGIPSAVFNGVN